MPDTFSLRRCRFDATGNTGTILREADHLSAYDGDLGPWFFVEFDDGLKSWVTQDSVTAFVAIENPTYRCPQCGSTGHLEVSARIWVRLDQSDPDNLQTDEFDTHNDGHEWDETSTAICTQCQWTGIVEALIEAGERDGG